MPYLRSITIPYVHNFAVRKKCGGGGGGSNGDDALTVFVSTGNCWPRVMCTLAKMCLQSYRHNEAFSLYKKKQFTVFYLNESGIPTLNKPIIIIIIRSTNKSAQIAIEL